MRKIATSLGFLLAATALAYAQTSPFDMSGERPPEAIPAVPRLTLPATPPAPAPTTTPAPAVATQPPATPAPAAPPAAVTPLQPFAVTPATPTAQQPASPPAQADAPAMQPGPASPPTPAAQAATPPAQPPQKSAAATAPAPLPPGTSRRYVVPFAKLGLDGEYDRKSWSVYLTPEQAAAQATFNFTYQNAIVVAPESSQFTILINNRVIGEQPVGSSDGASTVSLSIPPRLLQPGANLLTIEAKQRHRTDCTVQSTYELWSDIDPSQTYLTFVGEEAAKFSSTDAIRAIGVDGAGQTAFNFVVPALEQPGTTKPLLRLVQGLSILSGMPNQTMSFTSGSLPASSPGRMTVVVGTPSELQPLFAVPVAAQTAPLATFATDPRSGQTVLLITGPSWPAIATAIETIVSTTDRAVTVRRDALATQRWTAPDAPLIFADRTIAFSQLGVKSTEFSGRRFRTTFNIAVPADFYANAYGEATVLLDAAYTQSVLPGSHIDVYVNGNIASTLPITTKGGGIYRHLPIRVTMRHFKPGLNSVSIETILQTDEDNVCVPGTAAGAGPRFALFDTSEFHMPDFARVGQRPNLAALAGTGYPYSRAASPTPLFIDRVDPDTLSATATVLGQMALMAGRPIDVEPAASPGAIGDRDAMFVGSISQMPQAVLSQLNIATTSQATWRPLAATQTTPSETNVMFDEWRSKVSGGVWQGQITSFQEWLRRNFDISLSTLQFIPGAEQVFTPSNTNSFLIAQGANTAGNGTWTIVTAPSAKDLREGADAMTSQLNWPEIEGHVTTYSAATGKIDTVPVSRFDFIATESWTFANYRLIAANWLSTNVLSYAVLLVVLSLLIGVATAGMLGRLGRRQ
ncbi:MULTISPECIES: cellulose biosynthesis cyclic di-GMP-binding regulatory protein BcsB [unclassified Rhizobium]|uniref:cellulose biosynthesis cyclic di-GMP-binding regulatory protein BcsB n=1 Tax=unclassified Rhizobium TaxID=2613769 RepID=UPI001ADCA727|nr:MULTISPECIES: cellulose biosynthesis cyclic di-GMP-binding regulatory protein BcsB [unclassified Rhizobium]MBO9123887.1 cellulose biosynthesis cyclic di-GMP-binding regulatory protein BcsB [Rhizobium sp. 16-488-2b]MBO9174419.1 cellulose biosynthesis cyclic di-GMP-binding regulatory protein BcsB [Rhizobium sp. 16-488-2a]